MSEVIHVCWFQNFERLLNFKSFSIKKGACASAEELLLALKDIVFESCETIATPDARMALSSRLAQLDYAMTIV